MWSPPDSRRRLQDLLYLLAFLGDIPWGAWASVALYLSILSGIVVGLQYDYLHPAYSTAALELLAPYGSFFRSAHFFSSQLFFLFGCIHLLACYRQAVRYSGIEWVRLITILPVALLLLFTGYILRGDNTGSSAGTIAEHIIEAIPLFGPALNDLLFSLTDSGLRKVYLHHVIGLDLLLLFLVWNHLRLYRTDLRDHPLVLSALVTFSVFVAAPFEPDRLGISYISGPWFFLGLQELLRFLPAVLAGVGVPAALLILLYSAHPASRFRWHLMAAIGICLSGYAILTGIAWTR